MSKSLAAVTIRRLSALPEIGTSKNPAGLGVVAAFTANLLSLGYALNAEALEAAQGATTAQLESVLEVARALKGDSDYKPMYPNFPAQVAEASDAELYINAMLHYFGDWIGVRIVPDYVKAERPELVGRVDITVLGIVGEKQLTELANRLVTQGQPFSETDKADLAVLKPFVAAAETGIKENAASLAIMFPDLDWSASFKTIVDILRLAVAYSGGDVSLSENTRFKLTRGQRRTILGMIEALLAERATAAEDFGRHTEQWKRLAKSLHHGEYATRFPIASDYLGALQAGNGVPTFNARVEYAILNAGALQAGSRVVDSSQNYGTALRLLTGRPGVFARRLFELINKFPAERAQTVAAFKDVASQVSIPVLVQMHNHFSSPSAEQLAQRIIRTKTHPVGLVVDNQLTGDYSDVLDAIGAGLTGRKSELRVRIDMDKAAQYAVPLAVRTASAGLRQIGRGSRIKIAGDKGTVRLFMHWRNMDSDEYSGRVDLDLSAVFATEDFSSIKQVAYYNLREQAISSFHSGDITSAPDGAAEFIDIDIARALKAGFRYVLPTVYNYTRQPLSEVPEAWAGVMLRNEPNSGEIFDPATVAERFDLTVKAPNATPFAFDLVTRELIWLDTSVQARETYNYNVAANADALITTLRAAVMTRPMTVAELVAHVATVTDDADAIEINPEQTAEVLQLIS